MKGDVERLSAIEKRWKDDRRISTRDVEWLLDQARFCQLLDSLRPKGPLERAVDDMFGPRS